MKGFFIFLILVVALGVGLYYGSPQFKSMVDGFIADKREELEGARQREEGDDKAKAVRPVQPAKPKPVKESDLTERLDWIHYPDEMKERAAAEKRAAEEARREEEREGGTGTGRRQKITSGETLRLVESADRFVEVLFPDLCLLRCELHRLPLCR